MLPWVDDVREERLSLAMGGFGFKTAGQRNVVVAYVRHGEIAEKALARLPGLVSPERR